MIMSIHKILSIVIVVSLSFSSCKTSKTAVTATRGSSKVAASGTSKEVANTPKKQAEKQLSETSRLEFDKLYFDANKEQILGNMELAANLFSQCIKLDPSNAAAIYELAKIYNFNGNKEKAIELSGKAANLDQKNIWYQLLYADLLFANKQIGRASCRERV